MTSRRTILLLGTAGVLALALAAGAAANAATARAVPDRWTASWATAVQRATPGTPAFGPNWSVDGFTHQTVRQVVRVSAGGSRLRIRLSNRYGGAPLRLTGATVGRTGAGAGVLPGTVRTLTFHGAPGSTVAAGRDAASDPVALDTSALEPLTVSLYFTGGTGPATFHEDGLTTTYLAAGDHRADTGDAAFAGQTSHSTYYLAGVDVTGGAARGTVVGFGDSITNGHNSTLGADRRYTDDLADRLAAAHRPLAVTNAGTTGNLMLTGSPCFGDQGVARFDHDVLDQPGVRTAIVMEGSNDIWDSEGDGHGCGVTPVVTAAQLIAGYQRMIRAAHARGVRVVGATILPFKAFFEPPADFQAAEAVRVAVNDWVLTSGAFDATADFATAVADPADPQQLNPGYGSGDYFHPNDAGYQALADTIDPADL